MDTAAAETAARLLHLPEGGTDLSLAALDLRLVTPGRQGDIRDVLAAFEAVRLTAMVSGAGAAATHRGLLPKLRGALGSALLAGACAGSKQGTCRCRPACAAAVLFAAKPKIRVDGVDQEGAKPFVISAARHGGRDLALSVTLFGMACGWADAVRQALGQAVTGGLPWRLLGKDAGLSFARLEPALISTSMVKSGPLDARDIPDSATLEFVTGLELNNRTDHGLSGPDIFRRLTARASMIAPWMRIDLTQNVDSLQVNWDVLALEIDTAEALHHPRASRRTGLSWQSITRLPSIRLTGNLNEIWHYLVLGENIHIGRGATAGSGRYSLRSEG